MIDTNNNPETEAAPKRRAYLIDEWLHPGRVHVIAGPSDVGKTSLLFDMMAAWQNRQPWLGHATHGQETGNFYYIIGDRGDDESQETMERLDVNGQFKYCVVGGKEALPSDFYNKAPADARIIAIDAAERLVEGGKLISWEAVSNALLDAREYAERRKAAIILLVGSPKMKRNEEYLHGRENILGSSAWGRFSSTVFNIFFGDVTSINDSVRRIQIRPKNFPKREYILTLGANGFEMPLDAAEMSFRGQLLQAMTAGIWFTRKQLLDVAAKFEQSPSTLDKTLKDFSKKGICEHQYGKYRQKVLYEVAPPIMIPAQTAIPITDGD